MRRGYRRVVTMPSGEGVEEPVDRCPQLGPLAPLTLLPVRVVAEHQGVPDGRGCAGQAGLADTDGIGAGHEDRR